ncbi:MAG: hypothetical protein WBC93_13220, partial [Sulfitobacter sp.]
VRRRRFDRTGGYCGVIGHARNRTIARDAAREEKEPELTDAASCGIVRNALKAVVELKIYQLAMFRFLSIL